MTDRPIIDAHCHVGTWGQLFCSSWQTKDLLRLMDALGIGCAIVTDEKSLASGCAEHLSSLHDQFDASEGRLHYLAVFHPRRSNECLSAMDEAVGRPGFEGIKIHPSWHETPAEDSAYEPVWRYASEHGLPILAHTWSVSPTNPIQAYSTPERFEGYIREFPEARIVLGHCGARGYGRREAVRLANENMNVYLDFAGDVFCRGLIEELVETVPSDRVMYGSDFPWLDPRANLSRVLLSPISDEAKRRILWENAMQLFGIAAAG